MHMRPSALPIASLLISIAATAAACGPSASGSGGGTTPGGDDSAVDGTGSGNGDTLVEPTPVPPALVGGRPVTTEIQRRQAAACEQLGPKITACAIADAKATMTAEQLAELKVEQTAPTHTRKFIEACVEPALSSRQVRVYEVCMGAEPECEPLLACLEHISDPDPTAAATP